MKPARRLSHASGNAPKSGVSADYPAFPLSITATEA